MSRPGPPRPQSKKPPTASPDAAATSLGDQRSPLSLSRLRAAFAEMLGTDQRGAGSTDEREAPTPRSPLPAPCPDPCEISPRSVVEAMLFVGRPDDRTFSARELAAAMRGVRPRETDAAAAELNETYERGAAPHAIVG